MGHGGKDHRWGIICQEILAWGKRDLVQLLWVPALGTFLFCWVLYCVSRAVAQGYIKWITANANQYFVALCTECLAFYNPGRLLGLILRPVPWLTCCFPQRLRAGHQPGSHCHPRQRLPLWNALLLCAWGKWIALDEITGCVEQSLSKVVCVRKMRQAPKPETSRCWPPAMDCWQLIYLL